MKEKAGNADESTLPKEPGTVGVGGCAELASCDGETSSPSDEGMAANPASLGAEL
jgi:hypothetical protein